MNEMWWSVLLPFLISLFLGVFGLVFLLVTFNGRRKAAASQRWPSTQGSVVRSWLREVRQDRDDGPDRRTFEPEVEYSYEVGGQTYKSNQLNFGFTLRSSNRMKAETTLERYPTGAPVTVYYNPQKPQEAVLERQNQGSVAGLVVGGVMLTISACSFLFSVAMLAMTMLGVNNA